MIQDISQKLLDPRFVATILAGVAAELLENEDLPNTSDPASWARVSGRRGEKVVALRSLVDRSAGESAVD